MKKFNFKKVIAYVLVAMLTLGAFSMNVAAAEVEEPNFKDALEAAEDAGIRLDEATRDQLEAIVKEAADSLDIVEEGVQSEKSTFVSFAEHPVKVVEEDGEGHGLRGVAVKTIALTYVADTENLYVGITEDRTIYRSFEEPSEPGFYYAVCMYAGDDNNYPSVGYGIVVILPAEEAVVQVIDDICLAAELLHQLHLQIGAAAQLPDRGGIIGNGPGGQLLLAAPLLNETDDLQGAVLPPAVVVPVQGEDGGFTAGAGAQ